MSRIGKLPVTVPAGVEVTVADGSINVKLNKSDIDIIKPQSIQSVDIRKVSGWNLATYEAYERDGETFRTSCKCSTYKQ